MRQGISVMDELFNVDAIVAAKKTDAQEIIEIQRRSIHQRNN